MKQWKREESVNANRYTLSLVGKLAGNVEFGNAQQIEVGYHYRGGSKEQFGGADSWPTVEAKIAFCEGEEAKRDEFVKKLQRFIEQNI